MKSTQWIRILSVKIIIAASAVLTACQMAPLGLDRENSLINYQQLETADFNCRCETARLGGKVIRATALENQTEVEVLSMEVDRFSAKPILASSTNGRFIAVLNGFVDPLSLQDQYITVKGILDGKRGGKIDQANYLYPVIKVEHYRIWQQVIEYYRDEEEWADYWESRRYGGPWGPFPSIKTRAALR